MNNLELLVGLVAVALVIFVGYQGDESCAYLLAAGAFVSGWSGAQQYIVRASQSWHSYALRDVVIYPVKPYVL